MSRLKQALNLMAFAAGGYRPICGPTKVTWEVTYRCNMKCRHCHLWQTADHDELTTDEARAFIRSVAETGAMHMSFSGGEPCLRNDILELVRYAADLGLSTGMNTNGSRLADRGAARQACESGLGSIFISLDGPDPDTHNALRGNPGAFDRAIGAIDALLSERTGRRPGVYVNTTVTEENLRLIDGIVDLARGHGVDGMTMSVVQDIGKYSPETGIRLETTSNGSISAHLKQLAASSDGLIPHSEEYLEHFDTYLRQPDLLYKYRCAAGYAFALVHPNGEVQPCPVSFAKMGNVRERSFREIWFSAEANRLRKAIRANRHPICWFDCTAPLNILLHDIRHLRLDRLLDGRTISHIRRKMAR